MSHTTFEIRGVDMPHRECRDAPAQAAPHISQAESAYRDLDEKALERGLQNHPVT